MNSLQKVSELLNSLPSHMMFILRASNMVAIFNNVLGGNKRDRLLMWSWLAFSNVYGSGFWALWNYYVFRSKLFVYERFM